MPYGFKRKAQIPDSAVSKRIIRRREQLDMTQQTLAERSGISQTHISWIETGRRNHNCEVVCELAAAMKCSGVDLDPALGACVAAELRPLVRKWSRLTPSEQARILRVIQAVLHGKK